MSTYSYAHANAKWWIFDVQFPGNRIKVGIIWNHFWSSTICAIQIPISFPGLKNPKNHGIQPKYKINGFRQAGFDFLSWDHILVLKLPFPGILGRENKFIWDITIKTG